MSITKKKNQTRWDTQIHGLVDEKIDKQAWIYKSTDGGWMNGWTYVQMNVQKPLVESVFLSDEFSSSSSFFFLEDEFFSEYL